MPNWASVSSGSHVFVTNYVAASTAALTFEYHDEDNSDLASGLSSQSVRVQIFTAGSSAATTTLLITSPAVGTGDQPPLINTQTPVDIVAINSSTGTAHWALFLTSASGTITLASWSSNTTSMGEAPFTGAPAALIDPTQYANGLNDLELTDADGHVAESIPVNI